MKTNEHSTFFGVKKLEIIMPKTVKKTFLKKFKKSVDKDKNILYNTNRSPQGRTKSTLKSKQ